MKNSVLFSPDLSEKLNISVKEKVDKHLFLVCNYNPESLKIYSDDAKFLLGIMNLYKLLIDAGICNKLGTLKKTYSLSFNNRRLEDIISGINSFRTYLGHNEDYRNGNEDDKEFVESWFSRLIGNKYPETTDQYNMAVNELNKYGEECIAILESFVDEVSKHIRKEQIIEDWELLLFDFYKRPNTRNIIKGHLRLAYQARRGTTLNFREVDVALWSESMLFHSEQSMIDNLNNLIKGRKIPTSVLKEISKKIEEREEIIRNKKIKISKCLKKTENDLRPFDYLDYYIILFPQRIIEEYKAGKIDSLLPQDAVQQIIEEDYAEVPLL